MIARAPTAGTAHDAARMTQAHQVAAHAPPRILSSPNRIRAASAADLALELAQEQSRRTMRLTPRWTPLDPHPQQALFCYHPARFKINPSGRRSGKTELAKRKIVTYLLRRKGWPVKIFVAAPSYGQARDIYWQDLIDLIPPSWVASISQTRLEIVTKWGAMIRVFGFDRPRRIEGIPWDYGVIDEIADCPRQCFALNVRPALATRGRQGACDLIGVPDEVGRNQTEYEALFNQGLQWEPGGDTCSFHWSSADIIPDEVAASRGSIDQLAHDQEYGGQFVTSDGRALYDFDNNYHVSKDLTGYCPQLPIDWAMDFGVSPACSLLCQTWKGAVWVLDEIHIKNGSTDAQVEAFRDRVAERGYSTRQIRLFGDAAGKHRSTTTGQSDYALIEEMTPDLNIEWRQLLAPPAIKDTVNAVRGRCKTASGLVRLHIHPRCKNLIDNCKTAPWPDKLVQFHALAGLRYYCFSLFGHETPRAESATWVDNRLGGTGKRRQRK